MALQARAAWPGVGGDGRDGVKPTASGAVHWADIRPRLRHARSGGAQGYPGDAGQLGCAEVTKVRGCPRSSWLGGGGGRGVVDQGPESSGVWDGRKGSGSGGGGLDLLLLGVGGR